MKAAPFDHVAVTSVAGATAVLAGDGAARVLAGGQSLVPLLALRLARPTVLVDINRLALDRIDVVGGEVRIGALIRHRRLERDPAVRELAPALADAAALIGHPAIRNRGTIGGSLAHADPLAELPAALVALGGSVVAEGPTGRRRVAAADLFEGFLTTTLGRDELLVEVRVPAARRSAFCEWAPRAGGYATAGVGIAVGDDGMVSGAACGIGSTPVALTDALAGVDGRAPDDAVLREVAARVRRACGDGADDRAELAGLLAARALLRAAA